MAAPERDPSSAPPSTASGPRTRRHRFPRVPSPGAAPGTLVVEAGGGKPQIFLFDYNATTVVEKELGSIDEAVPYLTDDADSITWVDVRGLCDRKTLERMGEI